MRAAQLDQRAQGDERLPVAQHNSRPVLPLRHARRHREKRADQAHHRAWLLALLEQLVAHEPQALEEGGTLRRLWTAKQGGVAPSPAPALLRSAPPPKRPSRANPLPVPWFAQLDSATDEGRRMCFSSSCAMLLAFLKPSVLSGPNGDDQYLARVHQFGDTTDPAAQIKALASYGITARVSKQASFST